MKRVWQPNKRKRQKTHGFLVRMAEKNKGRLSKLIKARMQRGRKKLAPQAYKK